MTWAGGSFHRKGKAYKASFNNLSKHPGQEPRREEVSDEVLIYILFLDLVG
jgi:hypothetical protein